MHAERLCFTDVCIKAFQIHDVLTILALVLSAPSPKIAILADAVLPKRAAENDTFLFLELFLAAVFDPCQGIFSIRGELTPQSFVLSKACKDTGWFMMASFMSGSGHDDDWVLTAGGFHHSFNSPSHYPAAPPRVGFYWQYDSHLSISGEAYYIVTPQAIRDGGWYGASFSAYANLLLRYEPSHFQAQMGVMTAAHVVIGMLSVEKGRLVTAPMTMPRHKSFHPNPGDPLPSEE